MVRGGLKLYFDYFMKMLYYKLHVLHLMTVAFSPILPFLYLKLYDQQQQMERERQALEDKQRREDADRRQKALEQEVILNRKKARPKVAFKMGISNNNNSSGSSSIKK